MIRSCLSTLLLMLALACAFAVAETPDVAIVTAIEGHVDRLGAQGRHPLPAFARLKNGDLIEVYDKARVQIVYFAQGRQETWKNPGEIEVGGTKSSARGPSAPEVRQLPTLMARQIARTPTSDGRPVNLRQRSIETADAATQIEDTYRRLRLEATQDDLNPELYLLSSLFERRDFGRLEQAITDLRQIHANNPQAGLIVALYQKALRNARASGRP